MNSNNALSRILCIFMLSFSMNGFAQTHHAIPQSSHYGNRNMDTETSLPVNFGGISASLDEDELTVQWVTLYELRNTHFELEITTDGISFSKFADVKSKAPGGSSDIVLQYEHKTPKSNDSLTIGAGFLLALLAGTLLNRKKRLIMSIAVITATCFLAACNKEPISLAEESEKKLFVRITQVEQNGRKLSTKCVLAVRR